MDMDKDKKYQLQEDLGGDDDEESPAWLTSYSDMMTDLLAIFVILFSFAMMAVSQQNYTMRYELEMAKLDAGTNVITEEAGQPEAEEAKSESEAEFDRIYESIQAKINESGYAEAISLDKNEGYITFRFKDSVLFYPDSPQMRETSFDILKYMGDLLLGVDDHIGSIEIGGHTARVGEDSTTSFFAWELSADRAISVLKFFVQNCGLPQSKMVVSGYSHHQPVAGNDDAEARALNRRVEVKIIRVDTVQEKLEETP